MTRTPGQQGETHWEEVLQRILAAFMVASLILLSEKLLVQLISISYHRKQFDLKIKDSKHNVYLLSLLYDASRALFPAYCHEFSEDDYIINDSLNLPISKSASGHVRSGSATPMRLLQNVGRVGDKITAAFGNIAHEVTGKQVFNPTAAHSIVVEALEKKKSSEALARRIWMSFVVEGKEALFQEDIIEVLGADRQGEAEECFASLDRDGNGDISLDEMILTVCEFGRERKSIASSLHDVDQAINVLDNLLCTIVFVICVFIFGKQLYRDTSCRGLMVLQSLSSMHRLRLHLPLQEQPYYPCHLYLQRLLKRFWDLVSFCSSSIPTTLVIEWILQTNNWLSSVSLCFLQFLRELRPIRQPRCLTLS